MGDPKEKDSGNFSGSVVMLAMLDPARFGVSDAEPLGIFEDPANLLVLGERPARSSVGPDNRRTNAIEGILNFRRARNSHAWTREL